MAEVKNSTVTNWFHAGHDSPAREGWYEVRSPHGWPGAQWAFYMSEHWHIWQPAWFGDGVFYLGSYPGDEWRGLAEKA